MYYNEVILLHRGNIYQVQQELIELAIVLLHR